MWQNEYFSLWQLNVFFHIYFKVNTYWYFPIRTVACEEGQAAQAQNGLTTTTGQQLWPFTSLSVSDAVPVQFIWSISGSFLKSPECSGCHELLICKSNVKRLSIKNMAKGQLQVNKLIEIWPSCFSPFAWFELCTYLWGVTALTATLQC